MAYILLLIQEGKMVSNSKEKSELLKIYNVLIQYELTALNENKWLDLVECDIINPYTMLKQVIMMKEKKVKSIHQYAFTPCSDGRLATWVPESVNCVV